MNKYKLIWNLCDDYFVEFLFCFLEKNFGSFLYLVLERIIDLSCHDKSQSGYFELHLFN
jgi:hypothetical protein